MVQIPITKGEMGCLCVNSQKEQTIDEGESTIQQYEASLGFSHLPVDVIIAALEETSGQGKFNLQLMRTWLSKLNISTDRLNNESDSVACLYATFLEKGRYSICKLGLFAILLGEGSAERKATLLFRLFCKSNKDLVYTDVESMVETACDIALQQLPSLVEKETIALRDIDVLRKLQKYRERLAKSSNQLQSSLLQAFLASSYSEAEFVELVKTNAACLVSAQSLRTYACTDFLEPTKESSISEPSSVTHHSQTNLKGVKISKARTTMERSVKTPRSNRHS